MTNKYVQKGLNNKQKKEQKKQKLETILNTIDKNLFITDWNNALTYADIMKKYNIPDYRYLNNIIDYFNLKSKTVQETNAIIGKKRYNERLEHLISNINLDDFKKYHANYNADEMQKLFNISENGYEKLIKYLNLEKHSISEAQVLAQSHISKEKKLDISKKRLNSITPEIENERRLKIGATIKNKSQQEKDLIYSKVSKSLRARTEEQKIKSKEQEYKTKIKNGTLWHSAPEDNFEIKLKQIFDESDIKRNYNLDPRYPHKCDFYICSLDLFIELNFHPSHWAYSKFKEPFNPKNKEHVAWLSSRKELGYDCRIWEYSDRKKIQDAYDNNLNYIAFYDQKSFENDEDIVYSLAKVKGVHIVPGTH